MLTGLAAGLVGRAVVTFLTKPRYSGSRPLDFELNRRMRLREGSAVYRGFEPLIEALAGWNLSNPKRMEQLKRALAIAKEMLPWKPEEFLAAKQIESLLAGLAGVVVGLILSGSGLAALVVAGLAIYGYKWLTLNTVAERARKRMRTLKQRLPFAIDLMALTMGAGASFQESLTTVVQENRDHPLGKELAEVLRQVSLGRTRRDALVELQLRLQDDDVSEFVYAVTTGEELGTPLSEILRGQAEQLRLKRSQWAEKAAGEAQVNIVFPGMAIMLACLLIIAAPFLLTAFLSQ